MKKIIITLIPILSISFLYSGLFADSNESDVLLYEPRLKFPSTIVQAFRMDESTEVVRTYSDSTQYKYKRDYTYYFRLKAPGKDQEGIQKVEVYIDSLEYRFNDDKGEVYFFNSQDAPPPTNKGDFLKTFIPNSYEFTMDYSFYGEAGNIEGERLKSTRADLVHPKYGIKNNDYKLKLFQSRLSDEALTHIVDVAKGLLPGKKIALDSAWPCEVDFFINDIHFKTLSNGVVDRLLNANYYITVQADTMEVQKGDYLLPDVKQIAQVEDGLATTKFDMKISTRGVVEYLSTTSNATIYGSVNKMKFREEIKSVSNWNQIGLYKW